jgi:DNA topoisomerase-1
MELENGPYTLVIAEKPDAAQRIATGLDSHSESRNFIHSRYWIAKWKGKKFVVCPASGHLFGINAYRGTSGIYPVFDVFWASLKKRRQSSEVFIELAKKAEDFVIACDYDVEGDTIGYNLLKYACNVDPAKAFRAKFSTLAAEDIVQAFDCIQRSNKWPMAIAGRSRHMLDFIWGINISRVLSLSGKASGGRYVNLSLGRVQGPTLNYVYERELERNLHIPIPFWEIHVIGSVDHKILKLDYEKTLGKEAEARVVKDATENKFGVVENVYSMKFSDWPPPAFNIGDLQGEAFKLFGFNPSYTLRLAENLYLKALISYPRTSSQKLPPSISYEKIMDGLSGLPEYEKIIQSLVSRSPRQGAREDPAHPAIFPTGLHPANLERAQRILYDLIVRRFLSAFSKASIKEKILVHVVNNSFLFKAYGTKILNAGYLAIYNFRMQNDRWINAQVNQGDRVFFKSVDIQEKFSPTPPRYNIGSLLETMERDDIGTKATRADIIDTLFKRGYIVEKSIRITELGMAVIESVKRFYPMLLSVGLTRKMEKELESLELGRLNSEDIILSGASKTVEALEEFEKHHLQVGISLNVGYKAALLARDTLGLCPICKSGSLVIIRSRKTGKRFVGCSNYLVGCKATAPLPQRGVIRKTGKACQSCGWPIVLIFFGRNKYPWRICVNMSCPRKVARSAIRAETKKEFQN